MAGRPAIQFYFGDWKKNKKLRFCSWAARGAWIEVMGLMHDSEDSQEYGILRKPLAEIAIAIGAPLKLVKELAKNGVMRGAEKGLCEPLIHTPKHARKLGTPVCVLEAQQGPIWYSARMVVDEYVRQLKSEAGRFSGGFGDSPMGGIGDDDGEAPNTPPRGRKGDGASTSTSSSEIGKSSTRVVDTEGRDPSTTPLAPSSAGQGSDPAKAIGPAVVIAKRLRAIGINVQAIDAPLLALIDDNFSDAEIAGMAAEKVLRKACMYANLDGTLHPDLAELLAGGATQQQMNLTDDQYATLRAAGGELSIEYIAKALRGRRADAASEQVQTSRKRHPESTDNFEGKHYAGTSIDQLSPELRARVAGHVTD